MIHSNTKVDESKESKTYEKNKEYLSVFLKSISNKDGTYKRVCITPLRYAGGKTKAVGTILANLPELKVIKYKSFIIL